MAVSVITVDTLPSYNPATGEVLDYVDTTPPGALPGIIKQARAVQAYWEGEPLAKRLSLIRALGERMLERKDELADAVVRESGKPRVEALFADVFVALDTAKYIAAHAVPLLAPEPVDHHSTAAKAKSGTIYYEPLRVVGIISSWNYPLAIPLGQIIPALAAGNAVICKNSDLTPQCGALIERLFLEAGFPKNLVTVVQGSGAVAQALISASPDKIFFTGSVATGRKVAEACAAKLIPSVLELGGKDAMLVLADADLEVASSAAVWGSYTNCGQVCLSVERLYVDQKVSEKFIQLCVEKTGKLRLGPGGHPDSDVGPMIRPQHVARMTDLIDDAVEMGARVLCGGRPRPDLGPCFFEPTVIAGVDASMRLFQEETFGPILAIRTVSGEEEAVRLANDSPFCLSASVWSSDSDRGEYGSGAEAPEPSWSTTPSATSPSPRLPTAVAAPAAGDAPTAAPASGKWCKPNTSTWTASRTPKNRGGIAIMKASATTPPPSSSSSSAPASRPKSATSAMHSKPSSVITASRAARRLLGKCHVAVSFRSLPEACLPWQESAFPSLARDFPFLSW